VRRTILTLAAVLAAIPTALAQSTNVWQPRSIDSEVVVDPEEGVPGYKRKFMPPDGYVPPDQRALVALSAPIVAPTLVKPEPVVMLGGAGGLIGEHVSRFWSLKLQGVSVEMRGGCWSACTLITSYIPKDRLCFAAGSFLAFHGARGAQSQEPLPQTTLRMYATYPAEIQRWIDRNGGPYKMTVETYRRCTLPNCGRWAIRDISDLTYDQPVGGARPATSKVGFRQRAVPLRPAYARHPVDDRVLALSAGAASPDPRTPARS
jgi:hypothetical protein